MRRKEGSRPRRLPLRLPSMIDTRPLDSPGGPPALRRLIAFRYAVAVLVAASVLSLHLIFDAPIRWPPAMAALGALVLVDVALHWYVTARGAVSESAP